MKLFAAAIAIATIAAPLQARDLGQRIRELPPLELAFQAANIADCASTMSALHHGYRERNPFLGDHPSDRTLIAGTVGVGVLHAAGTMFLQDHAPRLVKVWEIVSIGVKGGAVVNNIVVRF